MKLYAILPLALLSAIALGGQKGGKKKTAKSETGIQWMTDFEAAKKLAKKSNRWILVDFFATWCGPCKMLDKSTYLDPRVRQFMANYVPLKLDVDLPKNRPIAGRYNASALPSVGFIGPDGKFHGGFQGYRSADDFLAELQQLRAKRKA